MSTKLWKKTNNEKIQCLLCAQFCELGVDGENNMGKCGVRKNENGSLISFVENKIVSYNADPIEKKPLYHFLPSTAIFSIGSMGCNFDCTWCQNSSIAHPANQDEAQQGHIVDANIIINACIKHKCKSIAFTYNEPTIFFELMENCALQAKKSNIKTVIVSNGYQSNYSLKVLLPHIDAANIDLKSFREETYQRYCNAHLKPVLQNIKEIAKSSTWLEITTLIIPGVNDGEEELKDLANFIAQEVGPHIPWHVAAFHPSRKMMNVPKTSLESLQIAYHIGKNAGLEHVYMNNVQGLNETCCTNCKQTLIKRSGYKTTVLPDFDGICPHCNQEILGVWH